MLYQPKEESLWPWVIVIVVTMVGMVYFLSSLTPEETPKVIASNKDPNVLEDLSSMEDKPTPKASGSSGNGGQLPSAPPPPTRKRFKANFKREGGQLPQRRPEAERATADGQAVDLVITDIIQDGPYAFVIYKNAGSGGGSSGDDFGITLEANGKKFVTGPSYRRYVPKPDKLVSTGGYALTQLGINEGWMGNFVAHIDPEKRVNEQDENNNSYTKMIRVEDMKSFSKQGMLPPRGPQRSP